MSFERAWNSSCPHVWDQWEAEGTRYVIQDLRPEDDDMALRLLLESYMIEEPMRVACHTSTDKQSVLSWKYLWSSTLGKRMSLACYVEKHSDYKLVAVNCCSIYEKKEKPEKQFEGGAFWNILKMRSFLYNKNDCYKLFERDLWMTGSGLIVKREYRKSKIGTRILDARETLCRTYGIKGSFTIFTSVGGQKCAEGAGFTTLVEATWKELADAGVMCPSDKETVVKLMVKKYI